MQNRAEQELEEERASKESAIEYLELSHGALAAADAAREFDTKEISELKKKISELENEMFNKHKIYARVRAEHAILAENAILRNTERWSRLKLELEAQKEEEINTGLVK